jgi:hypothetical protein
MHNLSTQNLFKTLNFLEKELLDRSYDEPLILKTDNDINKWSDIAQILYCKCTILNIVDKQLILEFRKLDKQNSFHQRSSDIEAKYGVDSLFATVDKLSKPYFLYHYLKALDSVKVKRRKRVLNLGVNSGSEFEAIKRSLQESIDIEFGDIEFVGVDYCQSAIEKAKHNFKDDSSCHFINHDINNLASLNLGKFDLIVSIGTLQSSSLNFKPLFMDIFQNNLNENGAMILGFPNCRWIGSEMFYGAKAPNYNYSEMSILYNDVMFCKKYLQQKKFRVTITGRDYIFLTATSIRKDSNES